MHTVFISTRMTTLNKIRDWLRRTVPLQGLCLGSNGMSNRVLSLAFILSALIVSKRLRIGTSRLSEDTERPRSQR
jgi:hypothetical protein